MAEKPQGPVAWFPKDKPEEMELVGATEKTSAHEAVRVVLETFTGLAEELENAGLAKGFRVVLIGSAVSEFKRPEDVDLLLLYDHVKPLKGPLAKRRARRRTKISPAAAALYGRIDAYDKYQTAYGKMDTTIRLDAPMPPPIPATIDVTISKPAVVLDALNESEKSAQLEAGSNIEMITYEGGLPTELLLAVRAFPCLMDILQEDIPNYEYARMQTVLGETEESTTYISETEKQRLVREFVERYTGWIADKKLRERLANLPQPLGKEAVQKLSEEELGQLENKRRRIRRDLMGAIALHLMDRLPGDKAEEFRRAYTSYHLGHNWIQNAIEMGAVLLKGENLYNKKGEPVFRQVDRDFLKP